MLYIYIYTTLYVYIYICSIHLTVRLTREIALNRGHLCWHEVGHHWFCCKTICAISRRVFCCGRVGIDIMVLWFCVLHGSWQPSPSVFHNLWVGFLCSYRLFWEIFVFLKLWNPIPQKIPLTLLKSPAHTIVNSPKHPWWGMLVGHTPFHQNNLFHQNDVFHQNPMQNYRIFPNYYLYIGPMWFCCSKSPEILRPQAFHSICRTRSEPAMGIAVVFLLFARRCSHFLFSGIIYIIKWSIVGGEWSECKSIWQVDTRFASHKEIVLGG